MIPPNRRKLFASALAIGVELFAALPADAEDYKSPPPGGTADVGSARITEKIKASDPFEGANRVAFDVNQWLDHALLRPVALGYRTVVPESARNGFRNFMNNLNSPIAFANNIFQGELDGAGNTLARFALNSTIGVGGLFDIASDMDIPYRDEDFGQTLAVWGIDEGPYLYLLFMGPSSVRDLTGFIVDRAFDPLTYISGNEDGAYVALGLTATSIVDYRARNIETLDDIERSSVDYYASIRSLYRQSRANSIRNGAPSSTLPEFEPNAGSSAP